MKMSMNVNRTFSFDAAHHLPNVPAGHKCGREHGHTYTLHLGVQGPIDLAMGWVIDFADLDECVKRAVIDKYDHQNLNDFFDNPTVELMALQMAQDINLALPAPVSLAFLTLQEGHRNSVTVVPENEAVPQGGELDPGGAWARPGADPA